tara:strand:- start:2225 stop:3271 length:1047 start_codon:yes stop_codon:yes gene_type:complete
LARKRKGRVLDGVILLDKPKGMTSNFALQKVRRLLCAQKAGHTGSLDPLATGVLPICLGEATKFSRYLLGANKGYITTAKLGDIRTTSDSEGESVLIQDVPPFSETQITDVLSRFKGQIDQTPTMYSALKHNGKPLYEYARQGITIDRPSRPITIFELELLAQRPDELDLKVACSKGTYIRTLVEDIGQAVGCGAHVSMLRRYQAGHFDLSQTVTMEELESLSPGISRDDLSEDSSKVSELFSKVDAFLLPADVLLPDLTKICLKTADVHSILMGQAVKIPASENPGLDVKQLVALYAEQDFMKDIKPETRNGTGSGCIDDQRSVFLGVAEYQADASLQPNRLITFPG